MEEFNLREELSGVRWFFTTVKNVEFDYGTHWKMNRHFNLKSNIFPSDRDTFNEIKSSITIVGLSSSHRKIKKILFMIIFLLSFRSFFYSSLFLFLYFIQKVYLTHKFV